MKHFMKNLVLLPFRLTWDLFLVLFVILLIINIFCWAGRATGIGVVILLILLFAKPELLLLPLGPLLFLKHPWPTPSAKTKKKIARRPNR